MQIREISIMKLTHLSALTHWNQDNSITVCLADILLHILYLELLAIKELHEDVSNTHYMDFQDEFAAHIKLSNSNDFNRFPLKQTI